MANPRRQRQYAGREAEPDARIVLVFSLLVFLWFVAAVGPLAVLALDLAAPRFHIAPRTDPAWQAVERSAADIELEVRRRLYGERRETRLGSAGGERHDLNE